MVSRALGGRVLRRAVRAAVVAALVGLSFIAAHGASASSDLAGVTVVAQVSPYQAETTTIDAPSWLQPFGPLQDLPVWAVAAVLAAFATAVFLVASGLVRWAWRTFQARSVEK